MAIGTWIIIEEGFISFYPFKFGSFTISVYAGLAALMVNLLLTAALTPVFKTFGSIQKQDVIPATDFVRSAS
jgi:SSS family solute:Na+ symporter